MMICKELDAYDELLVFVSMSFCCLLLSNVFSWRIEQSRAIAAVF
jgi:hypothetical protein